MEEAVKSVTKRFTSIFDLVKGVLELTRDMVFLLLLLFILFWPAQLNFLLSRAGITSIDGGIFSWKQQVQESATQNKAAAQATSQATDSLGDVKSVLAAIAAESADPKTKAQAADALQKLDGSLSSLQNADQSLTRSLVTQENILQTSRAAPQQSSGTAGNTNAQGWVYLGEVDAAREKWLVPPQPKVSASSPVPAPGQTITLTDDLYLRADKAAGQTFNQAAINGAVRSGSTAKVLDVQPSHALNGGLYLWAKIQVTN